MRIHPQPGQKSSEPVHSWTARRIGWLIFLVHLTLILTGLSFQARASSFYSNIEPIMLISLLLLVEVWMVIGVQIISHHPRHPIGWLLCAGFFSSGLDMLSAGINAYDSFVSSVAQPWPDLSLIWLKLSNLGPFGLASLTLLVMLFPDGRFLSPGWRRLARLLVGMFFLFLPIQALEPGPADTIFLPERLNPVAVNPDLWLHLRPILWTLFFAMVVCYWAACASLFIRLHRAQGEVRQQIKWLLMPACLYGFGMIPFFLGMVNRVGPVLDFAILLLQLAVAGIVIAVGFAILRYRLYDIDLIIRRTLQYTLLSAILGLLYYGWVILFQAGLSALNRQADSPIAIVLTTLLLAGLFKPLRNRTQEWIDRKFYRASYDAEKALEDFSITARDEVDLHLLSAKLIKVVEGTMQPAHIQLLLTTRSDRKTSFAGK